MYGKFCPPLITGVCSSKEIPASVIPVIYRYWFQLTIVYAIHHEILSPVEYSSKDRIFQVERSHENTYTIHVFHCILSLPVYSFQLPGFSFPLPIYQLLEVLSPDCSCVQL